MQTDDINWEVIGFLEKCPSKKYLRKILEFAFTIRNKISAYDANYQTPVSTQFYADLDLSEDACHKMLVSLVKLLEKAAQNNFSKIAEIFPADFAQPSLQESLVEMLETYGDIWKKTMNSGIQQGDKLIDLDWRIDLQVATHGQDKLKHPVIFLQLETQGVQNQTNTLQLQMNSTELGALHANLAKIKSQLAAMVTA